MATVEPDEGAGMTMHCLVLVVALLCSATAAHARYRMPDLEEVPLARVIENLEARVKEAPDDVGLVHALARAHAMAYARKLADDAPVTVTKDDGSPWFGHGRSRVPFG